MKLDLKHKLGILIFGIIFITYFVNFVIQKSDELYLKRDVEFKENYKKRANEQRRLDQEKWNSYFTEGGAYFNESGDLQEGLFFGPGSIMGLITSVAQGIMGMMTGFLGIATMFSILSLVILAMSDLSQGIFNHVICGGKMFGSGFSNSAQITGVLAQCSGEKLKSFADGSCTRYYIADLLFGLIYGVFVELPIILIYAITTIDLQFLVDLVYEIAILPLDTLVFTLSGYHIVSWSDSVINKCYKCKGKINGYEINQSFGKWIDMYKCSFSEIINGFVKIFTSLVPSKKWNHWIKGRHMDGWDDTPKFAS